MRHGRLRRDAGQKDNSHRKGAARHKCCRNEWELLHPGPPSLRVHLDGGRSSREPLLPSGQLWVHSAGHLRRSSVVARWLNCVHSRRTITFCGVSGPSLPWMPVCSRTGLMQKRGSGGSSVVGVAGGRRTVGLPGWMLGKRLSSVVDWCAGRLCGGVCNMRLAVIARILESSFELLQEMTPSRCVFGGAIGARASTGQGNLKEWSVCAVLAETVLRSAKLRKGQAQVWGQSSGGEVLVVRSVPDGTHVMLPAGVFVGLSCRPVASLFVRIEKTSRGLALSVVPLVLPTLCGLATAPCSSRTSHTKSKKTCSKVSHPPSSLQKPHDRARQERPASSLGSSDHKSLACSHL